MQRRTNVQPSPIIGPSRHRGSVPTLDNTLLASSPAAAEADPLGLGLVVAAAAAGVVAVRAGPERAVGEAEERACGRVGWGCTAAAWTGSDCRWAAPVLALSPSRVSRAPCPSPASRAPGRGPSRARRLRGGHGRRVRTTHCSRPSVRWRPVLHAAPGPSLGRGPGCGRAGRPRRRLLHSTGTEFIS